MNEKLINEAMLFTAKHFNDSCQNFGKPVYFHCIKVAMNLFNNGYEEKLVVAGILHDLIEDTNCTYKDIKEKFGEEIANLVNAVSFNPDILDKFEQSKQMIDEAVKYGKDALIIKCVDMYENGKFFHLVTKPDVKEYLIKKYQYFYEVAKDVLCNELVFKKYLEMLKTIE